jgi:hypothetical protein
MNEEVQPESGSQNPEAGMGQQEDSSVPASGF